MILLSIMCLRLSATHQSIISQFNSFPISTTSSMRMSYDSDWFGISTKTASLWKRNFSIAWRTFRFPLKTCNLLKFSSLLTGSSRFLARYWKINSSSLILTPNLWYSRRIQENHHISKYLSCFKTLSLLLLLQSSTIWVTLSALIPANIWRSAWVMWEF